MDQISEKISNIGIVPVITLHDPQRDAAPLACALCAGDVPVAEVTFRAAGAAEAIKLMKMICLNMTVGAGTVTTTEQIDAAVTAGGQFISPRVSTRNWWPMPRQRAFPFTLAAPRPLITMLRSNLGWSWSNFFLPSNPADWQKSRP